MCLHTIAFLSAEVSIAEYRGQDGTLPPRQVAVKQLKSQVMTSASDVVDFVEEVRVLHRLSAHRYVPTFFIVSS